MKALEDLSMQYDTTVRNSENTVIQFTYGDDGLNPDKMENNDRPVDFKRLLMTIREEMPGREDATLNPDELLELVKLALKEKRFQRLLPEGLEFLKEIESFFKSMVEKQRELMENVGMDNGVEVAFLTWSSCRFTRKQLDVFMDTALAKCTSAYIEPGEAVGAIGAQSISEPGTQMTVRTLH
jgi:DNA-directed RNA polymerase III subunit RPC1